MKSVKILALLGLAFLSGGIAFAQGIQPGAPAVTFPSLRSSSAAASTAVSSTNVFQSLWAQNTNRFGCVVQNNGTNTMYVFFGPIATATKATSAQVAPGTAVYCTVFGTTITDQVSLTGTSGDAFYASQY